MFDATAIEKRKNCRSVSKTCSWYPEYSYFECIHGKVKNYASTKVRRIERWNKGRFAAPIAAVARRGHLYHEARGRPEVVACVGHVEPVVHTPFSIPLCAASLNPPRIDNFYSSLVTDLWLNPRRPGLPTVCLVLHSSRSTVYLRAFSRDWFRRIGMMNEIESRK